jgi:hypothetical protein
MNIKILTLFLAITTILFSCKSEEELTKESANMLSQGIRAYESNNLVEARNKFDLILNEYDGYPATKGAQAYLDSLPERQNWLDTKNSNSIIEFETFMRNYPNSKYNEIAKNEIERLKNQKEKDDWKSAINSNSISRIESFLDNYPNSNKIAKARSKIKDIKIENKKNAFDNAMTSESSRTWTKFLEDYPGHPKENWITKKIIELEVDEILGDERTGKMPQAQQIGYSENTSISIDNATGCELVIRYSGPEIKKISIPRGATRTVYLTSGSYRVAASACGKSYGNTTSLSGRYDSRFWIESRRTY